MTHPKPVSPAAQRGRTTVTAQAAPKGWPQPPADAASLARLEDGPGPELAPRCIVAQPMLLSQRRDLKYVDECCAYEAGLMAEEYFYTWKAGVDRDTGKDKYVEGCSSEGALMLMRNYGNCTVAISVVAESSTHWMFEATFLDVEKGVGYPRLFRQRKNEAHQRGDLDRLEDIAFQIGQSKAIRNAILAGIPHVLEVRCRAVAKETANKKHASDVPAKWKEFLGRLDARGVSEARIRLRLGMGPKDAPTADHIALLSSIGRAIQDEQTTLKAEFLDDPPVQPAAEPITPAVPPTTPPATA